MRIGSTHASPLTVAACLLIAGAALGQCPTPAVTSFPWLETFDTFGAVNDGTAPPPNWTQDTGDGTGVGADWIFKNNATPSAGTGPTSDHTTGVSGMGFYAYVEDSGATQAQVNLITPCLDMSTLSFPRLQFWVHSNNSTVPPSTNENFLSVDVFSFPGPVTSLNVTPIIGHIGNAWTLVQVDLTPFTGQTIQIQFRGTSASAGFTHDVAIDDIQVDDGPTFDVGVSSVVSPMSPVTCGTTLSANEIITVNVTNFGLVTLPTGTMIPLSFSVDGAPPTMATFTVGVAIGPFTSAQFTFPTTGDFSGLGLHALTVMANAGDPFPANDGITAMIDHGTLAQVATFPYLETFDNFGAVNGQTTPPQCWTQDPIDGGGTGVDTDWYFANGGVSGGQPPSDHTSGTGFFAYTEDASSQPAVNLETPEFDLTVTTSPGMRFWIYSRNTGSAANQNYLHVDVLDVATQMLFQDVIPPIGQLGTAWVEQLVSLNAFKNTVVKVIFRGGSAGGGSAHNIGIDDIEVFSTTPGPGQDATMGLAEFDINSARNANGFLAQPGEKGPFFATSQIGGLFTLTYRGQPNQPFILIAGDLTPNVLPIPIPGIGQVDVGGPLDMAGNLTTLEVLLIGLDATGLNPFANTAASGEVFFQFITPSLPLGILTSFQAIIYNSVSVITFTNAVEVTIVP